MFRIISDSKYRLLTKAEGKAEYLEDELSFSMQRVDMYINRCLEKEQKINELLKELEEYKTAFCDELAKRLELTERVLELEKEKKDE